MTRMGIRIGAEHTFDTSSGKYPLEIINCAKEDLDMKDELFGHADGVEVGAVADLAKHVGDACSTRFFECGEDAKGL